MGMFSADGSWNPPKFWTCEGAIGPINRFGVFGIEVMLSNPRTLKGYSSFVSGDPLIELLKSAGFPPKIDGKCIFSLCKYMKGKVLKTTTVLEQDGEDTRWRWIQASVQPDMKPRVLGYDGLENMEALKDYLERYAAFDEVSSYDVPLRPQYEVDEEATRDHLKKQSAKARALRDHRNGKHSY